MFKVETSSGLLFMDGEGRRAAQEAAAPQPAPAPPEAALVEAVRAGDREAFAGLYEIFAPMVHGILLARVPFDEVGDLVQEVFLVAFRKLDTLRPSAEAAEALAHIRALPEAYRETLVLRLVEGMTGPEIAARTGLQPASVRVNLHRGMKLLRARLEGKGQKR